MACSGAAGEACGGPDRLSIYATTGSTSGGGMALIPGKTGNWTSLGCYSDAGGARILSTGVAPVGGAANNSAQSCIAACEVNKFKYAGTEYSAECFVSSCICHVLFEIWANLCCLSAVIRLITSRSPLTMAVICLAMAIRRNSVAVRTGSIFTV